MSLIVQVNNGAPGGVKPPESHAHLLSPHQPAPPPPPAHVSAQHIVQHHPPPLDSRGTLRALPPHVQIPQLPQTPVRHPQLPLSPIRQHQLPTSPLRQHQLPQTPVPPPHMRGASPVRHILNAVTGGRGGNHCIMVNQSRPSFTNMLPQQPTPGLLPAAVPPQPHSGLIPTAAGLIPLPPRMQAPWNNTTILPPNTLHHQLFPQSSQAHDSDELDVTDNEGTSPSVAPTHPRRRQATSASPRNRGHNDKRNLPSQLALQDHNYVSRPPPTPPPASPPPEKEGASQSFSTFGIASDFSASSKELVNGGNEAQKREQQNLESIKSAGVGPMAPLISPAEEDMSVSSADDGLGEETETAPEEDANDDSITRCICNYLHDDGYMICCDKCSVWQHVVCMGLDGDSIPDEYLCELCSPRSVDRKRAKALQTRRRSEIFNRSSSSDGEVDPTAPGGPNSGKKPRTKKILDKKVSHTGKSRTKGGVGTLPPRTSKVEKTKEGGGKQKKQYRRRKISANDKKLPPTSPKKPRRKSIGSHVAFDEEEVVPPKPDASQQLRSWIDQYEEAVTNHYSPELRARLAGGKMISGDLRTSVIGAPSKCNVSLKGSGVKILTASASVTSNTPIIECKGKLMLASQFRSLNKSKDSHPYVFFYQLSDSLEICLDGKTYGNDSRFCRRSSDYNAELRHCIDRGSLHLFIVTLKTIEKNQEIVLPPDSSCGGNGLPSPLPSISHDLREIKKPVIQNGGGGASSPDEAPLKERKRRGRKKVKRTLKDGRNNIRKRQPSSVEHEEEDEEEEEAPPPPPPPADEAVMSPPINGDESPAQSDLNSPVKSTKQSPGKLGLPDSSGLIVGVNTINYDASSSVRNKAKSREERKMEMIMKAIEAMEKADARKRDSTDKDERTPSGPSTAATKRRRSNSAKNTDSNLDASSADEGKPDRRTRKKGRKSGPNTPQRRRSRIQSGGSISNMSADETSTSAEGQQGPFRFPKTKKMMMSDWLHECEQNDDDDVSANYLRGSRSPPGIATHLLRSAPLSPVKSVCLTTTAPTPVSAPSSSVATKKRWLRQAISEDHTEDMNGGASPSDYVTPLKKRRLANYKEDEEGECEDTEASNSNTETIETTPVRVPNGLKKKLLHNLVLEAVLDRAMEDMLVKEERTDDDEDHKEEQKASRKANDQNTAEVSIPEAEVSEEVKNEKSIESSAIKTPEPSSVFKSFFKSNVSLEELEAELEATKRQREAEWKKLQTTSEAQSAAVIKEDVEEPKPDPIPEKPEVKEEDHPAEVATPVSVEEDQQPVVIPPQEDSSEEKKAEAPPAPPAATEPTVPQGTTPNTTASDEPAVAAAAAVAVPSSPQPVEPPPKPKEKRRVSLADYKRRRQQEGIPIVPATLPPLIPTIPPVIPTAAAEAIIPKPEVAAATTTYIGGKDEPGTPTLDEQNASAPITLNTLPLFEKLEKLEQAQKENKKKAQNVLGLDGVLGGSTPPPPVEPKREDLNERLRKEFGVSFEDGEDGDATPTAEESPPPKQQPQSAPVGGGRFGFTPTQYPSYPANYPLPPYPSSTATSKQPVPPPSVPPHPPTLAFPPHPPVATPAVAPPPHLSCPPHPPPPKADDPRPAPRNGDRRSDSYGGGGPPAGVPYGQQNSRGYYTNRRDRDHDSRHHHRPPPPRDSRRNAFHGGRSYYTS